ncbi:beta-propeller domain-containing protein [Nocardioides zeae]
MNRALDTWRRGGMAAVVAAPLLLAACSSSPERVAGPAGPTGVASLVRFTDCDDLLGYFRDNALERVTAWGLEGLDEEVAYAASLSVDADSAQPETLTRQGGYVGPDHGTSETNNQEDGVDEADIVATDGDVVVAIVEGVVQVVDADAATALGSVDLGGVGAPSELLLRGSTLLVLGQQGGGPVGDDGFSDAAVPYGTGPARTVITEVDLSEPSAARVVRSTRVEGEYRSARLIGDTVHLVMVSDPPGLDWVRSEGPSLADEQAALEANRDLVEASTIADWLPQLSVDGGDVAPLLGCGDVGVPTAFSGFTTVSVASLEIGSGSAPTSSAGVVGSGDTVYASTERLVVASTPWSSVRDEDADDVAPSSDLHAFDISEPGTTTYVGSGRVEGHLVNQFAIDEAAGVVRVAVTRDASAEGPSSSSLVVLAERPGEGLVESGRVDGLGETEQIQAVRFLSPDLAAVVTFRQVDPLHLVDTSDPTAPELAGELKVPGYAAYLHPLAGGLLLGVGQHATADGRTTGLQASLFDITDPTAPRQVSTVTWDGHTSAVEWDHRAFLLWQDRVYLPAQLWHSGYTETVASVDVDPAGLERGPTVDVTAELPHGAGVKRVLVVDDRIWLAGGSAVIRVAEGNRAVGDVVDF